MFVSALSHQTAYHPPISEDRDYPHRLFVFRLSMPLQREML